MASSSRQENMARRTTQPENNLSSAPKKDEYWRYIPLQNATLRGDWETAKKFFEEDDNGSAIGAKINLRLETTLHVAVKSGRSIDFVKKLVDLMSSEALGILDIFRCTALHSAAWAGNTKAAAILVEKHSASLYIRDKRNLLPIHIAANRRHKDTLLYLLSVTKEDNPISTPFADLSGVQLLYEVVASEFYVVIFRHHMDTSLILLCNYGPYTYAIKASWDMSFDFLVKTLCQKWRKLSPGSLTLFYCIPGHGKCLLDNNDAFINMLTLISRKGLDCVDVIVGEESAGCDGDGGLGIDGVSDRITDGRQVDLGMEVESEGDPLLKFCPHADKVLLTAGWANGISHVGQKFEGGVDEFRKVLCKYAIQCGFDFNYVKNDRVRVTVVCAMKELKGCMWSVHARMDNMNGFFYVKTLNNEHTCGAVVRTTKNSHTSSNIVASVILERVRDKPLTRPSDVVYDFKVDYGLDISYRTAWLAVEKAKNEVYGDYSCSFDQLRWYIDAVKNANPGSCIEIDCDESSGRFKRLFVAFNACIQGFNYCRPLLFLDGTFLKGRYKGNLLAATAKDGNQGLFPLAFAVVDSENEDNWSWFLMNLSTIIPPSRDITFISDRNKGLLEAVPNVFPTSHHAFCLHHLKANLRDKLSGCKLRDKLVCILGECAYAPTVSLCLEKLGELKNEGKTRLTRFLSELPVEHWCNAYFQGQRYGEMWSNAAESFNSWIRDARHLPITQLVDSIRVQIMRQMGNRRELSCKWNGIICPKMESKLQNAFNSGRSWIVSVASDNVYEVHSFPSVSVDISKRTCSCYQWQLKGFPCAHAVTALNKSGKDLETYIEHYFYVRTYQDSYADAIYPIPTVEKPMFNAADAVVLPPKSRRPPGRPKKARITSRGEKLRQIRCGRCGRLGHHNRKSCKEAFADF